MFAQFFGIFCMIVSIKDSNQKKEYKTDICQLFYYEKKIKGMIKYNVIV